MDTKLLKLEADRVYDLRTELTLKSGKYLLQNRGHFRVKLAESATVPTLGSPAFSISPDEVWTIELVASLGLYVWATGGSSSVVVSDA